LSTRAVEAIALSLVWSIVNPSHEQRILEAIHTTVAGAAGDQRRGAVPGAAGI